MTMTRMSRWLPLVFVTLLCLPVQAGLVTRPNKTCGTNSYTTEVSAGCTTIKSTEVDADLNAILTGGVNNIETANINAAGLGTAAYANGSVTSAKLAAGSSINTFASGSIGPLGITTVETTISSMGAITTRGGRVIVNCGWAASVQVAAGLVGTVTLKYKVDGVLVAGNQLDIPVNNGTANTIDTTLSAPSFSSVPSPGSHTFTITGQTTNAGIQIITFGTNEGSCFVTELS